jgi:hypothetical protein
MKKTKHKCVYCKKTDAGDFKEYRHIEGYLVYYHPACLPKEPKKI